MCMSRPGRVLRVENGMAEVERGESRAWFNALPVADVQPGDWVLVHASLVLSTVSGEEAQEIEATLAAATAGELS